MWPRVLSGFAVTHILGQRLPARRALWMRPRSLPSALCPLPRAGRPAPALPSHSAGVSGRSGEVARLCFPTHLVQRELTLRCLDPGLTPTAPSRGVGVTGLAGAGPPGHSRQRIAWARAAWEDPQPLRRLLWPGLWGGEGGGWPPGSGGDRCVLATEHPLRGV